jgi:hypothetical protein
MSLSDKIKNADFFGLVIYPTHKEASSMAYETWRGIHPKLEPMYDRTMNLVRLKNGARFMFRTGHDVSIRVQGYRFDYIGISKRVNAGADTTNKLRQRLRAGGEFECVN